MRIFIRDDDLGWEPDRFATLLELHERSGIRLNAAAIPEAAVALYPASCFAHQKHILEIHTHGFAHVNHANSGKKVEFGERDGDSVRAEIISGRTSLESHFPENFFPAFVPPWNRLDARWTSSLAEAGYRVLSRFAGAAPVGGLLEVNPAIDLHTRKSGPWASVRAVMDAALAEVASGAPWVGIMIHHNRIGTAELEFLAELYGEIRAGGHTTHFLSELEGGAHAG